MSDEEPPDDNVEKLFPAPAERPILHMVWNQQQKPFCFCKEFLIDARERVVCCARCEREVDPFEALRVLCRSADFVPHRNEVERLKRQILVLEKDKKRLRAAVQKMRREVGEKPWTEWEDGRA